LSSLPCRNGVPFALRNFGHVYTCFVRGLFASFMGPRYRPRGTRRNSGSAVANAAEHHIGVPKGAQPEIVIFLTISRLRTGSAQIHCLVSLVRNSPVNRQASIVFVHATGDDPAAGQSAGAMRVAQRVVTGPFRCHITGCRFREESGSHARPTQIDNKVSAGAVVRRGASSSHFSTQGSMDRAKLKGRIGSISVISR